MSLKFEIGWKSEKYHDSAHCQHYIEQAGAELGQAQLKLGLDFTSTNLH